MGVKNSDTESDSGTFEIKDYLKGIYVEDCCRCIPPSTSNMEIHRRVEGPIGKYNTLVQIFKRCMVRWFGLVKLRGKDHEQEHQDTGYVMQGNRSGPVESE